MEYKNIEDATLGELVEVLDKVFASLQEVREEMMYSPVSARLSQTYLDLEEKLDNLRVRLKTLEQLISNRLRHYI